MEKLVKESEVATRKKQSTSSSSKKGSKSKEQVSKTDTQLSTMPTEKKTTKKSVSSSTTTGKKKTASASSEKSLVSGQCISISEAFKTLKKMIEKKQKFNALEAGNVCRENGLRIKDLRMWSEKPEIVWQDDKGKELVVGIKWDGKPTSKFATNYVTSVTKSA